MGQNSVVLVIFLEKTTRSSRLRSLNITLSKAFLRFQLFFREKRVKKGVSDVESILPELCRQHNSGLLRQYGDLFSTSLSDDSLVPIKVQNSDEEETFSSFTYASILLKRQSNFPKSLPFSKEGLPQIYKLYSIFELYWTSTVVVR